MMTRTAPDRPIPGPVPSGVEIGYAAGNFGKSVVWASFETFLLFYLVTITRMPVLLAGSVLALMMVWDGSADLLVSWWADRRARADTLARLISWGAPLCGLSFFLIFALPETVGRWPVVGAIVACRIGYTLCDVGHNTLLVRVAAPPRNASAVSGLRLIFSAMGGGVVGLAAAYILAIPERATQNAAFALFAALGGGLYFAVLTGARLTTRHLPSIAKREGSTYPGRPWRTLWRNRAFRRVLLLIAIQSCLVSLFVRALPFFGSTHFSDAAWGGQALSVITLMQALALPFWMAMARRWRHAQILMVAHLLMAIALLSIMAMPTANGALGAATLIGIAQGGMNLAIWAMMADSVRKGNSASSEALPVGLFLATLKYAAGLGNALIAVLVSTERAAPAVPTSFFDLAVLCLPLAGSVIIGWIASRACFRRPAPATF